MMARPLLRLRGRLSPPPPGLGLGLGPGLGLGSSFLPAAGWHSGGAGRSAGRGPSAAAAAASSSSPAGLYEVLGVPRSATQAQIKTAYYKQSFLLHPDRNAGSEEAAERFTRLHEAYLVLGSVGLRKKYDRGLLTREDLRTAGKPSSSGGAASASPGAPKRRSAQAYAPSRPPSSGKPIFDFDAFYRAHYGQQLEREREKRTKQQQQQKEQLARKSLKEERMHELLAILLLAATVSFFLRFL